MPGQSSRRWLFYIAAGVFVVFVLGVLLQPLGIRRLRHPENEDTTDSRPWPDPQPWESNPGSEDVKPELPDSFVHESPASTPSPAPPPIPPAEDSETKDDYLVVLNDEHESKEQVKISSQMTADGHWFVLDWSPYEAYNPNIIPHPFHNDSWYMIAQATQTSIGVGDGQEGPVYSTELMCEATFTDGKMRCLKSPLSLPVASTTSDACTGRLEWFNYLIGPSDPRVFMGPDKPYIIYVSASQYGCLGMWIHDLRRLVRWGDFDAVDKTQRFFWPTELKRPEPRGEVEKNWFAFWDNNGEMYLHHDIAPRRAFSRVNKDGSGISENLAPHAAENDELCFQRYMPKIDATAENLHQATNSLAITLCKRSDPNCQAEHHTYIMTIFHHKMYYGHNLYEPYVMLFKNTAPFEVFAIGSKPLWVDGRGKPGEHWTNDTSIPSDQSQMMFMVSMNWKQPGLNYSGYVDDDIMLAFGVEDRRSGGIDARAGDMLRDLNYCNPGSIANLT